MTKEEYIKMYGEEWYENHLARMRRRYQNNQDIYLKMKENNVNRIKRLYRENPEFHEHMKEHMREYIRDRYQNDADYRTKQNKQCMIGYYKRRYKGLVENLEDIRKYFDEHPNGYYRVGKHVYHIDDLEKARTLGVIND